MMNPDLFLAGTHAPPSEVSFEGGEPTRPLSECPAPCAKPVKDRNCTSLLSLFVDPERILRRLYVFAEEPCKSTITTSEPCSPVFKEAQPRPKKQSISLISRIEIFIVQNVFLLLVIYCCNKASNWIVTRSKELVFYSWIPLSPEVSRLSPFTYAQQHTRTSRTFYTFVVHQPKPPTKNNPSLVENLMSRGRRRNKF